MRRNKNKKISEYGDFQTPDDLAADAVQVLRDFLLEPESVIEPTCGRGAFLLAAIHAFPRAKHFVGVDINKIYLEHLGKQLCQVSQRTDITLTHADFFSLSWPDIVKELPEPVLILGNPPWVTSSELGALDSSNLPKKSNFQRHRGLDAITGKSNFDISEWMILQYLQWLKGNNGYVAVLCKTSVARKVLAHAWKHSERLATSRIYLIDAMEYFGVSVEACFFLMELGDPKAQECFIYDSLARTEPSKLFGYRDGFLVSDLERYERWKHLRGTDFVYIWRSGIKHDCSKVLELDQDDGAYRNDYGEMVDIEDVYLFPLYKSSDVSKASDKGHRKYLLVTQQYIGEETDHIMHDAPRTWSYLKTHEDDFSKRRSSIYRNRPPFSIFGLGEYTFAPWKVAISGFYKNFNFKCIGSFQGRPAVFDDTVYFLSCWSKDEADFITGILNSIPAQEFLRSMTFWGGKRPITAELLRRLSLKALSAQLDREAEYHEFVRKRSNIYGIQVSCQLPLGIVE